MQIYKHRPVQNTPLSLCVLCWRSFTAAGRIKAQQTAVNRLSVQQTVITSTFKNPIIIPEQANEQNFSSDTTAQKWSKWFIAITSRWKRVEISIAIKGHTAKSRQTATNHFCRAKYAEWIGVNN